MRYDITLKKGSVEIEWGQDNSCYPTGSGFPNYELHGGVADSFLGGHRHHRILPHLPL